MIVRLDSNQKIYVIPDIPFTQYTGYTPTYLIGSGVTTCTNVSGNTWIVYANPTGATVTWGGITGTLSDQTDLQAALNAKSGTGHTHTGVYAPYVHTHPYSGLTGLPTLFSGDYDDLTNKPDLSQYALETDLTGHTSDSTIHTTMAQVNQAISAATSGLTSSWNEITDKPSWLSGTTLNDFQSAHSHSQYLTGFTVTAPMVTGITASLYAPIIHTHAYSAITDTPDLSVYQPISGMSAYLTGVTWNIITGDISNSTALQSALNLKLDNSAYQADMLVLSGVIDDLEETVSGHTGNTTVHTTMTQVNDAISAATSGLTSISDFQTYTGTTAPAQFFPISGYSFVASGACEIATSGNEVTIYAPSGGTGGAAWGDITGSLSAQTDLQTALDAKVNLLATIKTITGTSYTVLSGDSGKILEFTNTGATTVTLATGLTIGFQVTLVSYGNGTTSGVKTIAAGTGATVKSANSALKLSTIFGAATAYYRGSNVWVCFGDLTA